ncbi:MAG: phage integrase N-terminal SAM-like domain-containing protein [Acidobacteriota bacterium]
MTAPRKWVSLLGGPIGFQKQLGWWRWQRSATTQRLACLRWAKPLRRSSPPQVSLVRDRVPASSSQPRLLGQLRLALRLRHYSRRTEQTYLMWVRRFIFFHKVRHPASGRCRNYWATAMFEPR